MRVRFVWSVAGLVGALGLMACSRAPDDVREWKPTDHDNTANASAGQAEMSDGGQMGFMGVDEVGLAAWRAQCVQCHGMVGRGDGPRGREKKARNLTDPAWQASVTDEQIAKSIINGKGNMPAADLPESTVKSLVRLVRLLNASGPPASAPDAGEPSGDAGAQSADAGARKAKTPAPKGGGPAAPAPSGSAP